MGPPSLPPSSYVPLHPSPLRRVSTDTSTTTHDEPVKLEPWDHITYIPDRRKVQNLNAQRKYRHKVKRRLAELEELAGARRLQALNCARLIPKCEMGSCYPDSELSQGPDIARYSLTSSTASTTASTTIEQPERRERRHCNVTESPCCLSSTQRDFQDTCDNGRDLYWEPSAASPSRPNSQSFTPPEMNDASLKGCCVDELEICPWTVAYNSLLGL